MSSSPLVVTVLAASGGLGSSTLALATGRRLGATGAPAVVVDLDPERGGLDVTAGIEHLPGRRWPALAAVRGSVAGETLLASLPHEDGCALLAGGGPGQGRPPAGAVRDVVSALVGSGRRVVLDCPATSPFLPDVLTWTTHGVLLVGLRTRALADADALVHRLLDDLGPATDADLRLVTRGGRPDAAVLDDVVDHLGLGHLHHLPDDPRVARDAERGLWPGTGRDAVRAAADRVVDLVDAARVRSAS